MSNRGWTLLAAVGVSVALEAGAVALVWSVLR